MMRQDNTPHEYEFDFGDKTEITTTKEGSVSHTFRFNEKVKEFKVSIKQLGEVCENSQSITVKVIADFRATDFDGKDFYTEQ